MSDKERKKKDGRNKDKKNKRMREAVQERKENAQPTQSPTDQEDKQGSKPAAATGGQTT